MKSFYAVAVAALVTSACATAPKPAEAPAAPAAQAPAPAPAPEPDCISGRVISDDDLKDVPAHAEVRLYFAGSEIAHQKVDDNNGFKFDGPLEKGKYELSVRSGVLHGTRALTYNGGAMKNVSVVIAKSEPHRRRRRRHHD
jgi:hypothetical protein